MSLETAISKSVHDAFRKELKVWEDVYERDGCIGNGSWLSINVGLQTVVADALISVSYTHLTLPTNREV